MTTRRELRNSVVVLTGASSGVGRAAALEFARRGAKLVLAARDAAALEEISRECKNAFGVETLAVTTDVRDEAAVDRLAEAAFEAFGRIDTWVNDAAVYMMGRFDAVPSAAIRELFETNVMGVVHGTRAALRAFKRQRSGVLVNVGSVAGKAPYAQAIPYCASKHAVDAITRGLRQELLGTKIEACLVVPATIDTPLFQHAANYTGREVIAMRPIYEAKRVALAIVDVAQQPRRQVFVGSAPRLMSLFWRVMPWLYERLQPFMVERDHLGELGFPNDPGNLAGPRGPHAIEGGWKARREMEKALPAHRDTAPTRA